MDVGGGLFICVFIFLQGRQGDRCTETDEVMDNIIEVYNGLVLPWQILCSAAGGGNGTFALREMMKCIGFAVL